MTPLPSFEFPDSCPWAEACDPAALSLTPDRRVACASPEARRVLSLPHEALIGRRLIDLLSPRDRAGRSAVCEGLARGGAGLDALAVLRGGRGDVHCRVRFPQAGGGRVVVLERVEESACLSELVLDRHYWRGLLRGSRDGVAVLDPHWYVIEHNDAFARLVALRSRHGVRAVDGGLRGLQLLLAVEGELDALRELESVRSFSKRRLEELAWHRAGRELRCSVSPLVLPHKGHAGYFLLLRDVTEEQEAARLRSEAALRAGRAEVASDVVHSLGNALNSLEASLTLLRESTRDGSLEATLRRLAALWRGGEDRDRAARALELLADKLERQRCALDREVDALEERLGYMHQVLEAQRRQSEQGEHSAEAFDLAEACRDAALLAGLDARSLSVDGPVPLRLVAPRVQVTDVLTHLLLNARQATEAAGRDDSVELRYAREGSAVRVEVADRGVGIPPGDLERIFGHGYTTKPGSTGMGLHTCANAARALGGSLTVSSDGEGEGARFVFVFPAGDASAATPSTALRRPSDASRRAS
ncbi:MAG: PAS domain-containing sensor histidine kinase [Planctomycetota bacterium]|nr:MAG: PAS domain-containing sensor histidine kinase [Planctomycetota bacterium]